MLFLSLFSFGLCEIFEFKSINENKIIKVQLRPDSINTGFFKPLPGSNMTYDVKFVGFSGTKIDYENVLYASGKLLVDQQAHISFNNDDAKTVAIIITSMADDTSKKTTPGRIQMKFENLSDTFNKSVAKKQQIEPTIFSLDFLLTKINNVITSSKVVSSQMQNLGKERNSILKIVVILSFVTLISYAVFNFMQLYFMKLYLNQKKYL